MTKEKDLTLEELEHFQAYLDYKAMELEKLKVCECNDDSTDNAIDTMVDSIRAVKLDLYVELRRREMKR